MRQSQCIPVFLYALLPVEDYTCFTECLPINAFTNDNKDDFADNFDYLGIIASHGSEEQKRDIVSLCTNNLNKNEKIAETLKILEKLELKSEASIKMISGALETFKSTHPALHKETIERLIEKFK